MNQQWKKIEGLDLNKIRIKFGEKKSWWWHMGHNPRRIENEYRQLLFLMVSNPDQTVVPWSVDVNDFWREHILDTTKYAADCHAVAGGLIHHHPHLTQGSPAYPGAYAATRKLYVSTFGESARKRRRSAGETDFGSNSPTVFSDGGVARGHHPGHHGAGQHAGGHHGGHGHSCGGHGHSCGGHSGCGGHGGH
jgi:hypothetical protein